MHEDSLDNVDIGLHARLLVHTLGSTSFQSGSGSYSHRWRVLNAPMVRINPNGPEGSGCTCEAAGSHRAAENRGCVKRFGKIIQYCEEAKLKN
jgi:hypothetical protein